MDVFDLLILCGAAVTVLGFVGLVWCILRVWRARRSGMADEDLRRVVQGVVPLNFGALAVSVLGLMMVVIGISLGA